MADKVKEVAIEEADRLKHLATDAARSGVYLYPIRVGQSLLLYSPKAAVLHTNA